MLLYYMNVPLALNGWIEQLRKCTKMLNTLSECTN